MNQKATGFASPAQGYEEQTIDLNRLLIRNPPATYFGRLETNDMETLGLPRGSILIVDRSLDPTPNSLVMIRHEGEFLCRLITYRNGKPLFTDGKKEFPPVENETEIIGVITSSIKSYGKNPLL
jgi:DNA polymerase V